MRRFSRLSWNERARSVFFFLSGRTSSPDSLVRHNNTKKQFPPLSLPSLSHVNLFNGRAALYRNKQRKKAASRHDWCIPAGIVKLSPTLKVRSISDDVITVLCSLRVFVHLQVSLVGPERPPPRPADLLTCHSLRTSKYWTSHSRFVRWLPTGCCWRTAAQPHQIDRVHFGNFVACLCLLTHHDSKNLMELLTLNLSLRVIH